LGDASRYYNLWRIDPAGDLKGYTSCLIPLAKEFFREYGKDEAVKSDRLPPKNLQSDLYSCFQAPGADLRERFQAGLCLRCYVSEPILKSCQKIDYLFGEDQSFSYRDLLPFVLNDDGKTLLVLDPDGKTQLALDASGTLQPTDYRCFSLQILQTFKPNARSSMSLDNWAYLQTKQNPELRRFLSEFGFQQLSDWALMNRTRPKQLEQLTKRDRHLIEAFHAVYRRDRRQQQQGKKRCQDPTKEQLQEMLTHLQVQQINLQPQALILELRAVALQLREYDLWSHREPLELEDPDTGDRLIRPDLPPDISDQNNLEQQEQQELLAFFRDQLQLALVDSIQQVICDRIRDLKKSRGYAGFVDQFIPGLLLYYRQGMGLKDIADLLNMSGWAQARRVLNPGEVINLVRTLTIRQLLGTMLKKAAEKGLTPLPPEPNYLENLAQQIEEIADAEIFKAAFSEIQTGKNRALKSVYAEKLCHYLETYPKVFQGAV
jgi:hypothetical protein